VDYPALIARLTERGQFRIKPGLERIRAVLDVLGNPQDAVKSLHIAGTNGKGSTAAYLESVLRQAGYKTGLYTSPHLWDVRERIQIGRRPIGVAAFWNAAQGVLEAEQKSGATLTYFEFLTAMAFTVFARERVGAAVIEAGMGGRWDATNALTRPDLTLITSIGLDHTQWLGRTDAAIAKEKAGIAKAGVPLISGARGRAAGVIARQARAMKAPLRELGKDFRVESDSIDWERGRQTLRYTAISSTGLFNIGLLGPHQIENAALALAGLDELVQKGWKIGKAAIHEGLAHAEWAGRFELYSGGAGARILFDGAHNPAALERLLETLKASPWRAAPKTVVFGAYKDKDYTRMLKRIRPQARRIITCTMPGERALAAKDALKAIPRRGRAASIVGDPREALRRAIEMTEPDGLIIVTGSLALVGQLSQDFQSASVRAADDRHSSFEGTARISL
jgi:dihydrofolate synthase/folylpolyglutamate synthase